MQRILLPAIMLAVNNHSSTVAYAGFLKGGGGGREFRKFGFNEDENKNCPAQNQVCFPAQT